MSSGNDSQLINSTETIFILGGGPAGLSAGYSLAGQNIPSVILEKESLCGGMSQTLQVEGCYFDYGPHLIHSTNSEVLNFLFKILGTDLIKRKVSVRIFFKNRFVHYPIKGLKALLFLNRWTAILAIISFFLARLKLFLRISKSDGSFKDWISNRFGKVLFDIYFGPYAEKAWKIPVDEISAYVAQKRVPTLSIKDYLRSLLKIRPKSFHREDPSCIDAYYPRYGIGQVSNHLEKLLLENGGRIRTQVNIEEIMTSDHRLQTVKFKSQGVTNQVRIDFLFSTIPLNELVGLIRPPAPAPIREAADKLDYCSERLLYILVNKKEVFESPLVYFQDPKILFNRIYGINKIGPDCIPEGKEALCVEFTCTKGDEIWEASDKHLFNLTMEVLEKIGVLKEEEVETYFTKKVTHAYPRFRKNFQNNVNMILEYLQQFENLAVFGRQGLFCYANVDEVLGMGFKAPEIYLRARKEPINYKSIFKDYLDFD